MNADLQPLGLQQSGLEQLKDIHLPPPISTWPIAPGWIALFVILLATLCYTFYFWYKAYKRKYTAKFALAKLEKLEQLWLDNPENKNIAAEISILLRRTALYYHPRENIAGLSGKLWLQFLNNSGETKEFMTEETGRLLTDAPYRQDSTADLTPLFTLARSWLRTIAKKKVNVTKVNVTKVNVTKVSVAKANVAKANVSKINVAKLNALEK